MHIHRAADWTHTHLFHEGSSAAERSTWLVVWITAATMLVEIAAGWWFNSMALLADGWHMSSHAVAIGLSALAYSTARRYAGDARFAFGTWKIEILAAFASAIFLLCVAAMMVLGSLERLLTPMPIRFPEAIAVAALGLVVNLVCARLLGSSGQHAHAHGSPHAHDHVDDQGHGQTQDAHTDLNLKSAYLHVITDAATSVLAIIALLGGWLRGWSWLDPAMGIAGALLVAVWARGLIVETGKVLLDREMDHPVVDEIRKAIENDTDETHIVDLHVWRVGKFAHACAMTVVTHDPALTPTALRARLSLHSEIVHSTIEIHPCAGDSAAAGAG